jgi:hypothetical protein
MARLRIADDLPDADYEPEPIDHGSSYETGVGPHTCPEVKRPIGFMRTKPRVRVKAWTMPILPKDT